MKQRIIEEVISSVRSVLSEEQVKALTESLRSSLSKYCISEKSDKANQAHCLELFLSAKRIEGCSVKTMKYYENTINHLLKTYPKEIESYTTDDIRFYLSSFQTEHNAGYVTVDNVRRILSSFFSWLEEEGLIYKSPVRRIHKVKIGEKVKETISDENLELLRDKCSTKRDLAIVDLLASTGMRIGELVKLNIGDINFQDRECIVFGKGNKERVVYFNARAKIHLQQYLDSRKDKNEALFVSLNNPAERMQISGIELRLRNLGRSIGIPKLHPHKFRRTLATMAIDKGMPVEQVQKLLGHVKIDTTMKYAMVNQNNVKQSHRKYIG
ncbi:MAG: tyrosine-type recombinase/integrase [Bacteroidales bacterium]|nr:tyrosine-type recombinase/integrase [Bacteroidales bacterium]